MISNVSVHVSLKLVPTRMDDRGHLCTAYAVVTQSWDRNARNPHDNGFNGAVCLHALTTLTPRKTRTDTSGHYVTICAIVAHGRGGNTSTQVVANGSVHAPWMFPLGEARSDACGHHFTRDRIICFHEVKRSDTCRWKQLSAATRHNAWCVHFKNIAYNHNYNLFGKFLPINIESIFYPLLQAPDDNTFVP